MAANSGIKARFIESMECLSVGKIPDGPSWRHELKLDGYRMEVVRTSAQTTLYSRRENILSARFPHIATALDYLPANTILDGELVALDPNGKPNFNFLQNFRSAASSIRYYAFDVLMHKGKDLTALPLSERRAVLEALVRDDEYVELSALSPLSGPEMLKFVRQHGLEGVISKRIDSVYEPGKRTGLWTKHRVNLGQEFVIGGYVPSNLGLDSLVIGVYRGQDLYYASRVRAGFVPSTRRQVFNQIKHLQTKKCPFVNLREKEAGRWGQGLTAEKMKECVWLTPKAVAQVEFLEWTGSAHLRHTKFVAMREDKDPKKVVRET